MSADSDRSRTASNVARGVAVWIVLMSGLLALPIGAAAIGLVREQLHIGCSMGQPGTEGADTWTCSDGVGYVGVAATLGAMWFLAVLLGGIAAGAIHHGRTARTVLVLVAGASVAWILGWTWYGSSELVGDDYAPSTGTEYWLDSVGSAAAVCAAGMALALVSLFLRGRAALSVSAASAAGLIIAILLQPGLSINVVPAAGLLAAGAVRAAAPADMVRS